MSSLYRFEFNGSEVTKIEEYDDGEWKVEDIDDNETWTYDATTNTVTKTEVKKKGTITKTFTDADEDGVFISSNTGKPNGGSNKLFDITIDEEGNVTAVSVSKHGEWDSVSIDSDETWTYDATTNTVTRVEVENGYTETTLFAKNADGYYIRVSESYSFADGQTGGSGTDDIYYGKTDDSGDGFDDNIKSGDGDDYIESYDGDDVIDGGAGNDYIQAGAGDDRVNGGSGDDLLRGDDIGDDSYNGGRGNDTINYGNIDDDLSINLSKSSATGASIGKDKLKSIEHLIAGAGDDSINGSKVGNTIYGGEGDDTINGQDGNDTLFGDLGSDSINGGKGNDVIDGGDGDDTLIGGAGSDTLTGGSGSDLFVFNSKPSKKVQDTITDFEHGEDLIQLDDAVFKKFKNITDLGDHFVVGSAAADADDYLIYNSSTGALIYDVNGSKAGGVVTIATLGTGLSLDATDFAII